VPPAGGSYCRLRHGGAATADVNPGNQAFKGALDEDPDFAGVVFQALREIDTNDFMDEGPVYGGGLYKMEPKELGKVRGTRFWRR
jgi:hypothetical protein